MQRRTFLKFCTGALAGSALAACGGAHDGSSNLEPDPPPQQAPAPPAPAEPVSPGADQRS
jgi:hypothetical protein